jgi:enamine deaminase RidA (YjgF/YER057c/UK114 family)
VDVRKVNYSPGIMAGNWLFTAGTCAVPDYERGGFVTAPLSLPYYFSDIEIQTETTMQLLREQLEANGYTLADIVDARIFLVYAQRDYCGFERAWRRIFEPVGRFPSMSLIPSRQENGLGGIMVHELIIEIDLISQK